MAIQSYKPGPGTLTLGSGPLDVSAQVTACVVEPAENIESSDAIAVLSGEELPAEDTTSLTFTLKATLLQDLAAAGVVDFSWVNAGDEVAFTFVPNTVVDRQVQGTVRVVPITIGGPVKERATSDISWVIIGTPDFEAAP